MRAWEAALERRTDLERFWRSKQGQDFGDGWTRSLLRHRGIEDGEARRLAPHARAADEHANALAIARPIYVSEEMIDVWDAAARSFPGEPLLPTDPPWEHGFAWLGRARQFSDAFAKQIPMRAFAWWPLSDRSAMNAEDGPPGVMLAIYTCATDEPGTLDDEGKVVDEQGRSIYELLGSDVALLHATAWHFGRDYIDPGAWYDHDRPGANLEGSIRTLADMQVFFRLVQQRVAVPDYEPASRGARRRAGAPKRDVPEVAVVNLRRPRTSSPEPGTSPVEWTHRWVVDGFWRRQWYPSLQQHRLRYIAPYVKGPKDKPLVIKDKAYQWIR